MSGLRIVRPGEGRAWWWQGGIVRMPATGEDTGQRFMLEEATVPPGGGPAPHVQNREDESFDVIGGGPIEFTAGNRKAALGAGGFVNIGKGTAHLFRNVGDSPARVLIWNFPAGFERVPARGRRGAGRSRAAAESDRSVPAAGDAARPGLRDRHASRRCRVRARAGAAGRPPGENPGGCDRGADVDRLAAAGDIGAAFSMYRAAVPPGEPAPQPFESDVALYAVAGTLGMEAGDDIVEAAPGTLVQVPAHTPLAFRGTGDQRATMLIWAAPAHDLPATVAAP